MVTVNGLVIRERTAKENDKYLSILTDTLGLIEVQLRALKRPTLKMHRFLRRFAMLNTAFLRASQDIS